MAFDDEPADGENASSDSEGGDKGGRAWLLPAIVTGVFGLLGVVAGGVVSWKVQSDSFDDQQAAAVAADRRVAVGTARLMQIEFQARIDAMNATRGKPPRYPRAHLSLATRLSAADQRTVASAMAAKDWAAVAVASARVGRAQRMLDRHPGERLSRSDLKASKAYRKQFEGAVKALDGFQDRTG